MLDITRLISRVVGLRLTYNLLHSTQSFLFQSCYFCKPHEHLPTLAALSPRRHVFGKEPYPARQGWDPAHLHPSWICQPWRLPMVGKGQGCPLCSLQEKQICHPPVSKCKEFPVCILNWPHFYTILFPPFFLFFNFFWSVLYVCLLEILKHIWSKVGVWQISQQKYSTGDSLECPRKI